MTGKKWEALNLDRKWTVDDVPILFEDDALIAVNKPTGMLVHRGWGSAPVVLVDLLRKIQGGGKVHTVHRLDRATSGVILFAKSEQVARDIMTMFEQKRVSKGYIALARGFVPDGGIIDYSIPRFLNGPRMPAVSEFHTLKTIIMNPRPVSLVAFCPRTGRLHQVRRHLKHIAHPIIGDSTHGIAPLNIQFHDLFGLSRLALHAFRLRFAHPATGCEQQIEAPLPEDLTQPLSTMGFTSELWEELYSG